MPRDQTLVATVAGTALEAGLVPVDALLAPSEPELVPPQSPLSFGVESGPADSSPFGAPIMISSSAALEAVTGKHRSVASASLGNKVLPPVITECDMSGLSLLSLEHYLRITQPVTPAGVLTDRCDIAAIASDAAHVLDFLADTQALLPTPGEKPKMLMSRLNQSKLPVYERRITVSNLLTTRVNVAWHVPPAIRQRLTVYPPYLTLDGECDGEFSVLYAPFGMKNGRPQPPAPLPVIATSVQAVVTPLSPMPIGAAVPSSTLKVPALVALPWPEDSSLPSFEPGLVDVPTRLTLPPCAVGGMTYGFLHLKNPTSIATTFVFDDHPTGK